MNGYRGVCWSNVTQNLLCCTRAGLDRTRRTPSFPTAEWHSPDHRCVHKTHSPAPAPAGKGGGTVLKGSFSASLPPPKCHQFSRAGRSLSYVNPNLIHL